MRTSIIIILMFVCCICALFWRLTIRRGSQNRDYIKKQYSPRLTKKHMGMCPGREKGGGHYIPRLRVTEEYIALYSSVTHNYIPRYRGI
jgi:hypothetical protein